MTSVTVIDLSLADDPKTKPQLLSQLRASLLDVGFFYLKNYNVPESITESIKEKAFQFFKLPLEEKLKVEMTNSPHFLGYTRLANEITKFTTDWREQIDFAADAPAPGPNEPIYNNLRGPSQYPSEEILPGFKKSVEDYIDSLADVGFKLTSLVCESIGLSPDAFNPYISFSENEPRYHKLKIIAYPDTNQLQDSLNHKQLSGILPDNHDTPSGQGVGPHRDSGFLTYLLQVTPHTSLQVLNKSNEWEDVPPIDDTLVIAVGQALEAISRGVCVSTIHRVISPPAGSGLRVSIPFFQGANLEIDERDIKLPSSVLRERDIRDKDRKKNGTVDTSVGFQFKPDDKRTVAETSFYNRIKSHPDVAKKWYPKILEKVQKEVNEAKIEIENLQLQNSIKSVKLESSKTIDVKKENIKTIFETTSFDFSSLPSSFKSNFDLLVKFFAVIDNIIALHFTSRSSILYFESLKHQVESTTHREFSISRLQQILTIWPESYHLALQLKDYSITVPNCESGEILAKKMMKRKQIFIDKYIDWIEKNLKSDGNVSLYSLDFLSSFKKRDATTSLGASRAKLLRNDPKKFTFKEPIIETELKEGKGLSVLEKVNIIYIIIN